MSSEPDRRLRVLGAAGILLLFLGTVAMVTSSRGSLISGFVNSAIDIHSSASAGELAQLAVELDAAPEISDRTIRAIVESVLERAKQGDPQAALVALEIAERQRDADAPARP